jgi:hypothetical protein
MRSALATTHQAVALAGARTTVENASVIQPIPIALLIAVALAFGWRASNRRGILVLAMFWVAYALYEYLMFTRILCSGECNIRVDLLLIYPALLGCTLWVVAAAVVRAIKRRRSVASDA